MVFPARSTIYADTYPRTIEIEANASDPNATKPVIYTLDFKRIAAKTAYWVGRPAMRIVQALSWFRDDRSSLEPAVSGIIRHLAQSPHRQAILQNLRENIQALPAWMFSVMSTITAALPPADDNEEHLYVCWVLDFLFNRRPGDAARLYFKGGTSLSTQERLPTEPPSTG
ncbi:hypothetical protein H009_21461 [Agrobacterium tumefaciens str. Cherry 2E-2-2]|nr:hypothetical protein H009_21461 [Agrobacterium tumefaciens str. Cherry 2E-2-2]